jgi:hypothetical protein
MISKSIWFIGGKGLDKFRKNIINCKQIPLIKHYKN